MRLKTLAEWIDKHYPNSHDWWGDCYVIWESYLGGELAELPEGCRVSVMTGDLVIYPAADELKTGWTGKKEEKQSV